MQPSGRPLDAVPAGMVTIGPPSVVQGAIYFGSPVDAMPIGRRPRRGRPEEGIRVGEGREEGPANRVQLGPLAEITVLRDRAAFRERLPQPCAHLIGRQGQQRRLRPPRFIDHRRPMQRADALERDRRRAALHFVARGAERSGHRLEGRSHVLVGIRDQRVVDENDRRLAAAAFFRRHEGRSDGFERIDRIVDRVAEEAGRVVGRGQRRDAEAADRPRARLEGADAAIGRGPVERRHRLRAKRCRHGPARDHGGGAAARPARRMIGVVRIARRRRIEEGEFGRMRLAEDDRAGGLQRDHDFRIGRCRRRVLPRAAVAARRQAFDVDDVLDADRDAVQRAAKPAVLRLRGAARGGLERPLAVHFAPGFDMGLDRRDAIQITLDQVDGRQVAGRNGGGEIAQPARILNVILVRHSVAPLIPPTNRCPPLRYCCGFPPPCHGRRSRPAR